ncbi:MAG: DGQHR domain-containing protein [Agathobacter sp.]|nr:DGQHR domain-containing protein [Agathobacter sp.]
MRKCLKVIEVNQDGNIFYIGKMKARELAELSTTKVRYGKSENDYMNFLQEVGDMVEKHINEGDVWYLREFDEDPNVQRRESLERLKEIGKYIEKANSIFPNAIICNISLKNGEMGEDIWDYVKVTDDSLSFDSDKIEISIIDGQHRLGGFRYAEDSYLDKYELVVTYLVGLLPAQQAELFATINGKQKPVNKSVLYDLSTMSEDEYSQQMMAHLIVTWFNVNEKSPLRNYVKMLGSGSGTISQAALIDGLMPMISQKKGMYKKLDDVKANLEMPIFYENYRNKDSKYIVQNLYDYLNAVKKCFEEYWNANKGSILVKTTGIIGLLMAYPTIYAYLRMAYGDNRGRYSKEMLKLLEGRKGKFIPIAERYEGGGKQVQKKFACEFLEDLFDEKTILETRVDYIENFM